MKTWTIYALSDARDGEPRYIGVTSQPLRTRLSQHLTDAHNRQIIIWLELLRRASSMVAIDGLYTVDTELAAVALEASTIRRFSEEDVPLVNRRHGRLRSDSFTVAHLALRHSFGRTFAAFAKQNTERVLLREHARTIWNGGAPDLWLARHLEIERGIPLGAWLDYLGPRRPEERDAA